MEGYMTDYMFNKEYLTVANSLGMWLAVIPTVIILLIQGWIFIRDAKNAGEIVGLTPEDCKTAMRSGAICTIGPGCSMFTVMVAFMSQVGGPFAWLRLSIIGTIVTETLGANAGATAMGTTLGDPETYGIMAFTCSVWVITLNTWGFFIVNLLFAHRIEDVKVVMDKYDTAMFTTIGNCLMIGCIAMFLAQQVVGGAAKIAAAVAGFVIMGLLSLISKKHPRFNEYTLGIALILAILVAEYVKEFIVA